jgi:hypothetical protein
MFDLLKPQTHSGWQTLRIVLDVYKAGNWHSSEDKNELNIEMSDKGVMNQSYMW